MPQILEECVQDLMAKGYAKHSAYAICVTKTGYKKKKGGGWTKRKPSKS